MNNDKREEELRIVLRADTGGMAKKPDPSASAQEPPLSSWSIYQVADHGSGTRWLGTVEAPDKDAAIEKAAGEFKVDARRLYAVERR